MGKKSKNKAKAQARQVGGEKPLRCLYCSSLFRTGEANHATCPGCSCSACGRCESKFFRGCSRGDDCVLPMRRCPECVSGNTLMKSISLTTKARIIGKMEETSTYAEAAMTFGKEVMSLKGPPEHKPFLRCGRHGCLNSMCCSCVEKDSAEVIRREKRVPDFFACADCFKVRCRQCARPEAKEGADFIGFCSRCCKFFCPDCDNPSFCQVYSVGGAPLCQPCYLSYLKWSEKPCTNPDCTNEAGMVETKRCGDCHVARYCSKACQSVMRSAHRNECIEIKKKRERRAARHRLSVA